jgi:PEP-CTERM motif
LGAGLGWSFSRLDNGSERLMLASNTLSPVPEPEIYAMLLAGLGLLAFAARRRRSL